MEFVKIEQNVPVQIFYEPVIKQHTDDLFHRMNKQIRSRYKEIRDFIALDDPNNYLSYEKVTECFKIYFFKQILNEAVKIAFSEEDSYDLMDNIFFLLNEENLEDAIMGPPMINAFESALHKMPNKHSMFLKNISHIILSLEKHFLGTSCIGK